MNALQLTIDETSSGKPLLSLTSQPKPTLAPSAVLVKIKASAITPSDVLNSNGGFNDTSFPRIPGRDYAGIVEDGPAHLIGTEVYGTSGSELGFTAQGTHAEYVVLPSSALATKPSNLSFVQAATVGVPFTTAALTLQRANTRPGDTVLVLGASGSVGSAICQLAIRKGCKVLTAGRHGAVDVNLATDPEMKRAKELTGGKGPDVVVDTTGSPTVANAAIQSMAEKGRFSFISAPRSGSTEMSFDMKALYRAEKSIIGCNSVLMSLAETAEALKEMAGGFEKGQLSVSEEGKLDEVKLEDAVSAYDDLKAGTAKGKKYVIVMQ